MEHFSNIIEELKECELWELEKIRESLSDVRFNSMHKTFRLLISANIHMIDELILEKSDVVKGE